MTPAADIVLPSADARPMGAHAARPASAIAVSLKRDLLLAARRRSELLTMLFFFVVVVSLFPLGIGSEPALLRRIAPGVLWVAALLATLLGLPRLFAADHADGTLEQMALASQSFALQVIGKVIAHWLTCGLPLVLLAPLLGLQFGLQGDELAVLTGSLLLGTPLLSLLGAIGAALTLGIRGAAVVLSLLVLPLFIPALVFGAGSVDAYIAGLGVEGHWSVLAAMLLLAAVFAPWAITAALRIAME